MPPAPGADADLPQPRRRPKDGDLEGGGPKQANPKDEAGAALLIEPRSGRTTPGGDQYLDPDFDPDPDRRWSKTTGCCTYFPRRWVIVGFCLTADLICYMDRANISVTVMQMADEHKWSRAFQGMVFASFFIGLILSHLIGGYLADRYGAHKVLTFGVFWWSLMTILTPVCTPHRVAIILCRFFMGVGEGVNFPCCFNLFSRWLPRDEQSTLVSIGQTGAYIGTVLSMLLVPPIEHNWGWEMVFYIFGVVGIVWSGVFYVFGASNPDEYTWGIDERERRYIKNTVTFTNVEGGMKDLFAQLLSEPAAWAIGIAKFAYYYGFYTILTWQPTYYNDLGMSEHMSAFYSAIPFVVTVVMIAFYGWLASYLTSDLSMETLKWVRRGLGGWCLFGSAACFAALCYIDDAVEALAVICVMYFINASYVAGIAVNVLDIGAKYAGTVEAFTREFATMSGILATTVSGVMLEGGDFTDRGWMLWATCGVISALCGVVFVCFAKGTNVFHGIKSID